MSLLGLVLALGAAPVPGAQPFRVGFSTNLFTDVNDTDARASIRAWAQTVARERGINMSPSAQLYDRTEELVEALKQGTVDAMSMTFDEYVLVSSEVRTSDWFVTRTSGSLFEEYVLLVRADSTIEEVGALEGRALLFHESARNSLALEWLDHLLMSRGYRDAAEGFFSGLRGVGKVSAAVLPVFFGKEDAALVAESSFEVMSELNPQLRRELTVLARSRPLVPAILCFRADFESPEKDRVLAALRDLHETPAGEQVLMIFQSEELVSIDEGPLRETAAFLEETERLRTASRPVPAEPRLD